MAAPAVSAPLLDAARAIAPLAAQQAADAERERRLTDDVATALRDAGLFRAAVPADLGGAEAPPADLVAAVEALAAGDGAAGWCVAVCATAGMLAAYLEPAAAREVYGDARATAGGVFAPKGQAVTDGEALVVDGCWPFASNVGHCDWLMGGCVVVDGGAPVTLPSGRPDVRLVLFPAADVQVIDTWSVAGLRATGSHDMAVAGLRVPAARSASLITDRPRAAGPLYAFPPFGLLAASIAGVALGIARGAVDDTAAMAGAATPAMSSRTLAQRPAVQAEIARAEAEVRAARALLFGAIDDAWVAARAGAGIPLEARAALRLAATHAAEAAAGAVDRCWRLAGGRALYTTAGPLERRFRDVHAATQHMLVASGTWELAGRVRLGLDTDASQL